MIGKAQTVMRWSGIAALASLLIWAFTGTPIWAPIDNFGGREGALTVVHVLGLFAGAMSFDDELFK